MNSSKPEMDNGTVPNIVLKRLFFSTDAIGGWISVVIGIAALAEGIRLGSGTLSRLGSGAIPMASGILLLCLGALLIIGAMRKHDGFARIPITASAVLVIVALASFAVLLPLIGFLPAAATLLLISTMAATGRIGPIDVAFAVSISALSAAIFIGGLGMVLPLARWPF